jgi:hypothetical protein
MKKKRIAMRTRLNIGLNLNSCWIVLGRVSMRIPPAPARPLHGACQKSRYR